MVTPPTVLIAFAYGYAVGVIELVLVKSLPLEFGVHTDEPKGHNKPLDV
jgi:hypothetical protein